MAISYPALDEKELLGELAAKMTDDVVNQSQRELSRTQVRRFYAEVKNIERCLTGEELSQDLYGRIKLVKAKALYAQARKSNKLPRAFAEFCGHYVDAIRIGDGPAKACADFRKFCKLFEAFVGYSYPKLYDR